MTNRRRGVFWVIDGELFAVPYEDNSTIGIAKSGGNYNHRLLWDYEKLESVINPLITILEVG